MLLKRAFSLASLGMKADAARDLRTAAAEFPTDVRPVFILALLLVQWDRKAEALVSLNEAIRCASMGIRHFCYFVCGVFVCM